jgi:predicted porin
MKFARSFQPKHLAATATFALSVSLSGPGRAEVTILKGDTWEMYTTGRVDAFFSYGWGDANPLSRPGELIPTGGGLQTGNDTVPSSSPPVIGADGNKVPQQGRFESMRVRSGFVPNVFGVGFRRKLSDDVTLNAKIAIWATIESDSQRKESLLYADAREGYLKVESKTWGSVLAGRALDLFSRGATQNDFMYGHGYGLGYPGNLDSVGPTNGMIGFGVLAAFFSPGIVYNTPNFAGIQLAAGVYDPSPLPGFYDATREARLESELTYDLSSGIFKLHLFGNGAFQPFYKNGLDGSAHGYGVGYGARVEVGPVHLGLAGHYGKGLGLDYAFESGDVAVSPSFELRDFDGYSALGQVVAGPLDFNAGWGMSRVLALASDLTPPVIISLPQQWAISAGVVYHVTNYFHLDVDYLHALATWSLGERQTMDFINTGFVATW